MKKKIIKKIKALGKPRPSQLDLDYNGEVALRQLILDGEVLLDEHLRLLIKSKK